MQTTIMMDRVSRAMTYGGACLATSCGYANGGTLGAPVMTLSDWGLLIGIAVGLFGAAIQYLGWRDKRDSKRREDAYREAEAAYLRRKEQREAEEHAAMMAGVRNDRRQVP